MMLQVDLGHGRGWAAPDAAASIFRIDAQIGHPVQVTEAGRTHERQAELRANWEAGEPGYYFALPPDPPEGPSVHQSGEAVDSDEHDAPWEENGWVQTALQRGETWHREYRRDRDKRYDPNHTAALTARTLTTDQGDIMGIRIISSPFFRAAQQQVIHNGLTAKPIPNVIAAALRQGGVPCHDYDDDAHLYAEINEVHSMGRFFSQDAADEMEKLFGDQIKRRLA